MTKVKASTAVAQIVARSFSARTIRALAARNVRVLSPVLIPDAGSPACWETGWSIDDDGLGRVLRFSEVMKLAAA